MVAQQAHGGGLEALAVFPDIVLVLGAAQIQQFFQTKGRRAGDADVAPVDVHGNFSHLVSIGVEEVLKDVSGDELPVPVHPPCRRDGTDFRPLVARSSRIRDTPGEGEARLQGHHNACTITLYSFTRTETVEV